MLLRLSSTLENHSYSLLERRALSMLAESHEEGLHLIEGDRSTLRYLARDETLPLITRQVYQSLYSGFTTTSSPSNLIDFHCIVEPGSFAPCRIGDGNITVSLEWLTYGSLRTSSAILAENLNDCLFYCKICELYMKSYIQDFTYSATALSGGGNPTHQVYSYHQALNTTFCYCIVDSDAKYPTCQPGETASLVSKANRKDLAASDFFILEISEIENLIPTCLMAGLRDSEKLKSISTIREIRKIDTEQKHLFLDLKRGLSTQDCNITAKGNHLQEFNAKYFADVLSRVRIPAYSSNTNNIPWILFPLGGQTLSSAIDLDRFSDIDMIRASIFEENLKNLWDEIGRKVASWCIASPRQFVS